MTTRALIAISGLLSAFAFAPASAADATCKPPTTAMATDDVTLALASALDCLGNSSQGDKAPEVAKVEKLLAAFPKGKPPSSNDIAPVVESVRDAYIAKTATTTPSLSVTTRRVGQITARLNTLISILRFGDGYEVDLDDAALWAFAQSPATGDYILQTTPRRPFIVAGEVPALEDFSLASIYATPCAEDSGGKDCAAAIGVAVDTVRAVNLIKRTLPLLVFDVLQKLRTGSELRNEKWKAYFGEAMVQYPWEIAVNGFFFAHAHKGSKSQLVDPPNWQFIFLHPEAALEYVDEAPDGDAFKPAVILEVAGANFWAWKSDGSTKNAFGASIGVLYTDRTEVTDAGVALTFHILQKYSIGVSAHDKDVGVFLNIPLSGKFQKTYAKAKETFGVLQ